MSKFFKHTPQKIGSSTSPTSDLALEVSEAFNSVEGLLSTEGTTLISFKEALGNALFSNLKQHKVEKDVIEVYTLSDNESDIVLENKPDSGGIIVYYNNTSGDTVTLQEIEPSKDFTKENQYKVFGKTLKLNIRIPSTTSLTVTVEYSTLSFDLADKKFLPNVIKKLNNDFYITPVIKNDQVIIDYETDLENNLDKYISNPSLPINFFYTKNRSVYTPLEIVSYTVVGNQIILEGAKLPTDTTSMEVVSYIMNTSTTELLDALLYEFLNHDHSNQNITQNISHNQITNRFINTDRINYKDSEVPNYEHPQYLNREGYNSDIDSVYENAFLGDFFISRVIDEAVQKFKGLDEDSYKIIFGDPLVGHSLGYSAQDESLLIDTPSNVNGLYIKTPNIGRYSLKINGSEFYSDKANGLQIKPELNLIDLTSKEKSSKYTVKVDKLQSEESYLNNTEANSITINGTTIERGAGEEVTISSSDENSVLNILTKTVIDNLDATNLKSSNAVDFNTITTSNINLGTLEFKKDVDGNLGVVGSADSSVNIQVPVHTTSLESEEISASKGYIDLIDTKKVSFPGVAFNTSIDNNLVATKVGPNSVFSFEVDTLFKKSYIETLTANEGTVTKLTAPEGIFDIIKVGGIRLSKTDNNDMLISSISNKLVIESPLEFLKTFITNLTATKATLGNIVTDSITMGNIALSKTLENNLQITGGSTSFISIDPLLKAREASIDKIKSEEINSNKVSSSSVKTSTVTVGHADITKDSLNSLVVSSNVIVPEPVKPSPDNPNPEQPEPVVHPTFKVNLESFFRDLNTVSFTATESVLNKIQNTEIISDILKMGKVTVYKNIDSNMVFSGSKNKAIFNLRSEFIDAFVTQFEADESRLNNVQANQISFGKISLGTTTEKNLLISDLTGTLNKILITAYTDIDSANIGNLTSDTAILDTIKAQKVTIGKILLSNNLEDLHITSETTNNIVVEPDVSFKKTSVEESDIQAAQIDQASINSLEIGGVNFSRTLEDDVLVSSVDKKLIVENPTKIDNLTSITTVSQDIETVSLQAENTISDNIFVGGIALSKNEEDDLEITSASNKIILNAPTEVTEISSDESSIVSLDNFETRSVRIGNIILEKDSEGNVFILNKEGLSNLPTLTVNSHMVSNILEPITIKGERAKGILNNIEMNILKIGNSTFFNSVGKTVITPDNILTDVLEIQTTVKSDKTIVEDLTANIANITESIQNKITMGNVIFNVNSEDDLEIVPVSSGKIKFLTEVILDKVFTNKANFNVIEADHAEIRNVRVGNVNLTKDPNGPNTIISRELPGSELIVDLPMTANDLKTEVLEGTKASFDNVKVSHLDVVDFIFQRDEGTRNLKISNVSQDTLDIKTPVRASKFIAEVFSAYSYTLYNNDKIVIDDNNYLGNTNNRFELVNNKTVSIVGNSIKSGVAMLHEKSARPTSKTYIAANSGADAVATEKNLFVETDTTRGTFLLKPTSTKMSKDGIVYGFNDTTAQVNVTDLTQWFRSDLFTGNLDAYRGRFSVNKEQEKNGISIGDTRISVTGVGTDCPPGLTIFESQDTVNFVRPLSINEKGCRDVTYQSVNTGSLNTEGDLSVDGSVAVTEDFIANGTIGATDGSFNGLLETSEAIVHSSLEVKGEASFKSDISFRNNIYLDNDFISKGRLKGRSLEVTEDLKADKSLNIGEDAEIGRQLTVKGGFNAEAGMTVTGSTKIDSLSTSDISTQNLKVLRNVSISGTSEVQGASVFKSSLEISGRTEIKSYLFVEDSLTAKDIYTLRDLVVQGKLSTENGASLTGDSISLGSKNSRVFISGELQFDTRDIKFNSPVLMYDNLDVTGDLRSSGIFENKGGINSQSTIRSKGAISSESSIESEGSITSKTMEVLQNLSVGNNISTNGFTADSISVTNTASISNLTISNSLSMPVDTSIVAGDVKFGTITQTKAKVTNSFAGDLVVAGDVEFLNNHHINNNLIFNDSLVINSSSIKGTDTLINVNKVVASSFEGDERMAPPSFLSSSTNNSARSLASSINNQKFARMDRIVCDSIGIFNQALVADTIYYKDLIFTGSSNSDIGAVNIIASGALYS